MITENPNAEEVRILNSENNTHYYFRLRKDRIKAFFDFALAHRAVRVTPSSAPAAMPGISGAAHYGLDCIFFGPKPSRFPAQDILNWIQHEFNTGWSGHSPNFTTAEIEDALGRWAGTVSQLLADGSERA
jgi:hypothetical protein